MARGVQGKVGSVQTAQCTALHQEFSQAPWATSPLPALDLDKLNFPGRIKEGDVLVVFRYDCNDFVEKGAPKTIAKGDMRLIAETRECCTSRIIWRGRGEVGARRHRRKA